jgi:hypothetical protein
MTARAIAVRLMKALLALSLVSEGRTNDLSAPRVRGSHSWTEPTASPSLADEWGRRAYRLVLAMERDLELYRRGGDLVRGSRQGREQRIRSVYRGRPSVEVAFIEGCSESLVRKVRANAGLDATTGERKPHEANTAPAETMLDDYRNR